MRSEPTRPETMSVSLEDAKYAVMQAAICIGRGLGELAPASLTKLTASFMEVFDVKTGYGSSQRQDRDQDQDASSGMRYGG